jgi:hypothetical protein
LFCPNCGARNSETDTTCQKCGFNLKEAAGAKFKGTMLMNNPAAADLRRSFPPAPAAPAPNPTPAAATPISPTEAQQMRAKLKGTMIGVAPPAAAFSPQASNQQSPAAAPTRQPSTPPAYGQPGPGQVNAPGGSIGRGGGTMIGTGIGAPGHLTAGAPAAAPQSPMSHGATQGFAATHGAAQANPGAAGGPAATIRSAAQQHPFAQTQVAAGANETYPQPGAGAPTDASYPEPAATRAMSQFEKPLPQKPLNTLDGTMVAAGSVPPAPRTDAMPHVGPQFSPHAGNRTNTPPMGMPATAGYGTETPSGWTGKTILLTVITCGLYQLFKKRK